MGWLKKAALVGCALVPANNWAQATGPSQEVRTLDSGSGQSKVASYFPDLELGQTLDPWQKLGPFEFHPHLALREIYNDNIYASATDRASDFVSVISPGFLIGGWDFLTKQDSYASLDYSPSGVIFARHSEDNTLDHDAKLNGAKVFGNLRLDFGHSFVSSSDPLNEASGRNKHVSNETTLHPTYTVSEKTSLEVDLRQRVDDYEKLISTKEWTDANWLNYQILPKVTMALGVGMGYLHVPKGTDSIYQQYRVRANYTLTGKLLFSVNGGLEHRQFYSTRPSDDQISPVFGMSLSYQPIDPTRLTLQASRSVQPSRLFTDRVVTATGATAGIEQRFFQKIFLALTGSYYNNEYDRLQIGAAKAPGFDFYSVRSLLSYRHRDKWSLFAYYQHDSRITGVTTDYDANQTGLGFDYLW